MIYFCKMNGTKTAGAKKRPGSELFSQAQGQLSSPLGCLTSVFGMGTGVSTPPSPPDLLFSLSIDLSKSPYTLFHNRSWQVADVFISSDQVLGRLVPVNSAHRCASISGLSTSSSLRGLTSFQNGRSHLGVGFVLRCFQRLSLPCLATRLYHWRDNRCTRGRSIPVLSY